MVTFQRRYQENRKLLKILKTIADVLIVIIFAYALTLFTCDRTIVTGGSMQPVIENEDTVLINRLSYAFGEPKRFDIIAFKQSDVESKKVYVKRVIGLPGETVQIKDGKVYINGELLEDDISQDNILTAGIASNEITLGEDEYFVLGDNRNNSEDSRFANIGMVHEKDIVGSVWFILNPMKRMKVL